MACAVDTNLGLGTALHTSKDFAVSLFLFPEKLTQLHFLHISCTMQKVELGAVGLSSASVSARTSTGSRLVSAYRARSTYVSTNLEPIDGCYPLPYSQLQIPSQPHSLSQTVLAIRYLANANHESGAGVCSDFPPRPRFVFTTHVALTGTTDKSRAGRPSDA